LNGKLENIERVERVLVALNHVFHFCRINDGKPVVEVAEKLNKKGYCFDSLLSALPLLDGSGKEVPNADLINQAITALKDNNYRLLINKLAQLNKKVMLDRKGVAWIEIDAKNNIKVRVKLEKFKLLGHEKLLVRWDYDYFLGSFLSISKSYLGTLNG
jgi:phospholipid N-methyltransferase